MRYPFRFNDQYTIICIEIGIAIGIEHILKLEEYRAEFLPPEPIPIFLSSLVNTDNDFDPDSDYEKKYGTGTMFLQPANTMKSLDMLYPHMIITAVRG